MDTCFILLLHFFFIKLETEGVNTWKWSSKSHSLSFKFVYLSWNGVSLCSTDNLHNIDYSILSFRTFLDQHEILSLNNKQQIMSIQPFVYSLAFTFKENKNIFLIYPVEEMYSSVGGLNILTSSQLFQETLYQGANVMDFPSVLSILLTLLSKTYKLCTLFVLMYYGHEI